jgi:uncharacterized damage-inducible protein DinB
MITPEPWLRGPLDGVHPLVMPVLFSFAQVREDLDRHVRQLSYEQLWKTVGGSSIGFHLKHLAGSVDRLATYLAGEHLSQEQLESLRSESAPDLELSQLLELIEARLRSAEQKLKAINPEELYQPRSVGRKELPTSVIGLIVHLAEHTQRHLGQVITLSQVVRQLG